MVVNKGVVSVCLDKSVEGGDKMRREVGTFAPVRLRVRHLGPFGWIGIQETSSPFKIEPVPNWLPS